MSGPRQFFGEDLLRVKTYISVMCIFSGEAILFDILEFTVLYLPILQSYPFRICADYV